VKGFAALAVVLLAACSGPRDAGCPAGKVCLRYGNASEPLSLDPQKATGMAEDRIHGDLFTGLTQDDPQGRPVPGMAERWDVSPDGRTWTFHLRPAVWSDGVPVTAEDFVFAFRRMLDPAQASEYASLLHIIENGEQVNRRALPPERLGVRAIDERTLEIRLTHPAPYLPELGRSVLYPLPRHVVKRWGDAWSLPAHFVGNGAFKVVEWRIGDRVRVARNPRYFDAAKVCVDEISYYPTVDAVSAERRVKLGELDLNADIPSNRVAFLKRTLPAYVRTHQGLGVTYLTFNLGVPALKDVRVRRALSMAIDRDFISGKVLGAGQAPAWTFVPSAVANYQAVTPPVWATWPFARRQAEARRLLAQAGYSPDRPLKLELKHRNTSDARLYVLAVQADWKSVGVQLDLVGQEQQIVFQDYRNRDFQVADASWLADFNDPMGFLYVLRSNSGLQNYGDFVDPAYDSLLEKADAEPDPTVRAGYLAQAEAVLLNDAPIAPVYFAVNKNLVDPKVQGWTDNAIDHHRARYLCKAGSNSLTK
jgi:oligopeptide transport system substrate-binding protein